MRNWPDVIQWCTETASACVSGMLTKPPPYDRAPTLNAVHASASSPPTAATGGIAVTTMAAGDVVDCRGRRTTISTRTAAERHEDEVRAEQGGGRGAKSRVHDPPCLLHRGGADARSA